MEDDWRKARAEAKGFLQKRAVLQKWKDGDQALKHRLQKQFQNNITLAEVEDQDYLEDVPSSAVRHLEMTRETPGVRGFEASITRDEVETYSLSW